MFCPKCGTKVDEDAVFCPMCGASISADAPSRNAAPTEQNTRDNSNTRNKKKSKKLPVIIGAVVVLFIIIIAAGTGGGNSESSAGNSVAESNNAVQSDASDASKVTEQTDKSEDTEQTNEVPELTQIFTNEAAGISFSYPADWEELETSDYEIVAFIDSNNTTERKVSMEVSEDPLQLDTFGVLTGDEESVKQSVNEYHTFMELRDYTVGNTSVRVLTYLSGYFSETIMKQFNYTIGDTFYLVQYMYSESLSDTCETLFDAIMETMVIDSTETEPDTSDDEEEEYFEPEPSIEENPDFYYGTLSYGDMMRYPEYAGTQVSLQRVQVMQDVGNGILRCINEEYYDYGYGVNGWILGDEEYRIDVSAVEERIIEGDVIKVYGTYEGLREIERVTGSKDDLPFITADLVYFVEAVE